MSRVFKSLSALTAVAVSLAFPAMADAEFPRESAALIAATEAYFDQIEGTGVPRTGKRPVVVGLPLSPTKASVAVLEGEAEALKRMGPVRNLTGYNVTWYPVDRLLGTVDFMGTWGGNRNLVCGYLTWNLDNPEKPELVSVDATYLSLDELTGKPAAEIHEALLDANCAFGALDENYAFFDVAG